MSGIKLSKLSKLVIQMNSNDPERRFNAMSELHENDSYYLEESTVILALGLASGKFENCSLHDWDDPSYCIMTYIHSYILTSHLDIIKDCFDDYSPRAKSLVLHQMLEICDPESISFFVENFEKVLELDKEFSPELILATDNVKVANILFPFLLKYLGDERLKFNIIQLLAEYVRLDALTVDDFAELEDTLIKFSDSLYNEAILYNNNFNHEFVYLHWVEKYPSLREALRSCIFLLGKLKYSKFEPFISKCLELNDPIYVTEVILTRKLNNIDTDIMYFNKICSDPIGVVHLVREFSNSKQLDYLPDGVKNTKLICDSLLKMELLTELKIQNTEYDLVDDIVVEFSDVDNLKLRYYKIKIHTTDYEDEGWLYVAVEYSEDIQLINSFNVHLLLLKVDEITIDELTVDLKEHRINLIETYSNLPHLILHPNLRYNLFGVYFVSSFVVSTLSSLLNFAELRFFNFILFFTFAIIIGFNYFASKRIEVSHGPSNIKYKLGSKINTIEYKDIAEIKLDKMFLPLSKKSSLTDFMEDVLIFKDPTGKNLDIIPTFLCDDINELLSRVKKVNPNCVIK
ncbi:MAG: hypothetical protein K0S34_1635 [Bacillales bacterium]|jgi:hypothetical protein|nr:hypothetical protein [Bacillales bacterium]